MRFRIYLSIVLLIVLTGSCTNPSETNLDTDSQEAVSVNLQGTLKINGAYTLYPLVKHWADKFMSIHPNVEILVEKNGTASGLSNVLSQSHGLAMTSSALSVGEETDQLWKVPVAKDGVVPIINRGNPYIDKIRTHGVQTSQLIRLFTQEKTISWGEILETETSEIIKVYTREEGAGTAEIWANFLWLKPEDLKGEKTMGDDEMIKRIQQDPYAVGYGNLNYVFDSQTGGLTDNIAILPIDFNQNGKIDPKECPCDSLKKIQRAIWVGKYPYHLCRSLCLVSLGKPDNDLAKEFIRWVLTKGQDQVVEMGYCSLNNSQIDCALKSLD